MLRLCVLVFLLLLFWAEQLQLTQVQHLLVLIHLGGVFLCGDFYLSGAFGSVTHGASGCTFFVS